MVQGHDRAVCASGPEAVGAALCRACRATAPQAPRGSGHSRHGKTAMHRGAAGHGGAPVQATRGARSCREHAAATAAGIRIHWRSAIHQGASESVGHGERSRLHGGGHLLGVEHPVTIRVHGGEFILRHGRADGDEFVPAGHAVVGRVQIRRARPCEGGARRQDHGDRGAGRGFHLLSDAGTGIRCATAPPGRRLGFMLGARRQARATVRQGPVRDRTRRRPEAARDGAGHPSREANGRSMPRVWEPRATAPLKDLPLTGDPERPT
jgi:hypothetical protein